MSSNILSFIEVGWEGLDEIVSAAIDGIFLLEESLQLVLRFLGRLFLYVDGVLQDLRVVHGAPSDKAPMVGKGWKLVFLYISMNSLLNVKVLAHYFL